MQAELKALYSPDVDPLKDFSPDGPFGILVTAVAGPHGADGQESFDFILCTPDWFLGQINSEFTLGRHYLFVRRYDYRKLENFVREYCSTCTGDTWEEVAGRIGRLGHWEFEDYKP